MTDRSARIWVGIDAGKAHHWATAIDGDGQLVLSRKVVNDETEILELIATVCEAADEVSWAVDISGRASTLLLTLLIGHGQSVVYIPGRTVNRMSAAYRGEGKTDAKDALVIADTARLRRDFTTLRLPDEQMATLQLLTAHRADLVADRVRLINRMRDTLVGISPALERAFDYSASKGAVTMLTGYQTPTALRRLGTSRLAAWLRRRSVRKADDIADRAVEAARSQATVLPGEDRAARQVGVIARQLLDVDEQIKETEREIREVFRTDERAAVIESMPGMGPILGAEFVAIVGDLSGYADAGRLASHAGLVPVPRDSGRRTGNFQRPKRYNRRLRHIFYLSAQTAMMRPGLSREFYLRKRAEGQTHVQAVLALARRRVGVLWAMLRDRRPYDSGPPVGQVA